MEDTPASPEDLETFRQEIAVYYRRQLNQRDASKMYNDRNKEARNDKKRVRMAALRASRADEPSHLADARRLAAQEAARVYREGHRVVLARKARRRRHIAKRLAKATAA